MKILQHVRPHEVPTSNRHTSARTHTRVLYRVRDHQSPRQPVHRVPVVNVVVNTYRSGHQQRIGSRAREVSDIDFFTSF